MSKPKSEDFPLPAGWEQSIDVDGRTFYIDHRTHSTSWIDPRDRFTKPQTFADCVGDELPYGWEKVQKDASSYFINHTTGLTQFEDPCVEWWQRQQEMLSEYLVSAHDHLKVKRELCKVKQRQLNLAEQQYQHLSEQVFNKHGGSTFSLSSQISTASTSKHAPDLLKADIALSKNRIARLMREINEMKSEMRINEAGVKTLQHVSEKMNNGDLYSTNEQSDILNEIYRIKQSLRHGELEKRELMESLGRLKQDFLIAKFEQDEINADMSHIAINDLPEKNKPASTRVAEMARLRLQYDEARRKRVDLQKKLAQIEDSQPGPASQNVMCDRDRIMLVSEKENLLKDLRTIRLQNRTLEERLEIKGQISQLENEINAAQSTTHCLISDRLKKDERRQGVIQQLTDAAKLTTQLEAQLRCLSISSLSSSSSLGSMSSLGSLASSLGSINSSSYSDLYSSQSQASSETSLPDLHRRFEKLTTQVSAVSYPGATPGSAQTSPGSSNSLHSLSPPISPYDAGPPPTYEQHLNMVNRKRQLPITTGQKSHPTAPHISESLNNNTTKPASDTSEHHTDSSDRLEEAALTISPSHAYPSPESIAQIRLALTWQQSDCSLHVHIDRVNNLQCLCPPPHCPLFLSAELVSCDSSFSEYKPYITQDIHNVSGNILISSSFSLHITETYLSQTNIRVALYCRLPAQTCILGCVQSGLDRLVHDHKITEWLNVLHFGSGLNNVDTTPQHEGVHNSQPQLIHNNNPEHLEELPPYQPVNGIIQNGNRYRSKSDGSAMQLCIQDEKSDDSTLTRSDSHGAMSASQSVSINSKLPPTGRPINPDVKIIRQDKQDRPSTLRRAQTPVDQSYTCRLSRSDSDSCMHKARGPFTRGSFERRSLRYKQPVRHSHKHRLPITKPNHPKRTSIDLELDLRVQEVRLNHLQEDINRLREMKRILEEARAGEVDAPSWLEDGQLEDVFEQADQIVLEHTDPQQAIQVATLNKKIDKFIRQAAKYRRNRPTESREVNRFREKMAYLTSHKLNIPNVVADIEQFAAQDETGSDATEEAESTQGVEELSDEATETESMYTTTTCNTPTTELMDRESQSPAPVSAPVDNSVISAQYPPRQHLADADAFRMAAQLDASAVDVMRKPPPPYNTIQIGQFKLELDQIGEEEIL